MTPDRDREKAAEFARREAERERAAGIDPDDAAGRYLADAQVGRAYRGLTSPTARWRDQPPTAPQIALLRKLGIPATVKSRGEAAAKIDAALAAQGKKRKRRRA